jgi:hypothetical protein
MMNGLPKTARNTVRPNARYLSTFEALVMPLTSWSISTTASSHGGCLVGTKDHRHRPMVPPTHVPSEQRWSRSAGLLKL